MLNFVLCDDETKMLDKLSVLFEKAFAKNDLDAKIVLKTYDYKDILNFMANNTVNVVVLDMEFKNSSLNGLDIAKEIRKINNSCYIFFITSHYEYLAQAFEYKTFAYIFKNNLTLDTISNTLTRLSNDISSNTKKFIKIDSKGTFIELNEIQFIEKCGMKLIYHTINESYYTYASFSKIENLLPQNFVRCHKSYIANINNISSISLPDNSITFNNDEVCYIGPKYKNSFMEVVNYDAILK